VTTKTPPAHGMLKTVPLLMLVVATGQFNRISISVVGTDRIIPYFGVTEERMGLVYSAFLLFYTLAMLPGGWFIDRFGARTALIVLGFGSTVFVALTGAVGFFFHGPLALWLGLLVMRSCLGFFNAPLHPASARMVYGHVRPESRSLANGLVTFSACLGISATYSVMGVLDQRFDWPGAFLVTSVLTLVVSLVWTFATRDGSVHTRPGGDRPASSGLADLWPVLRRRGVVFVTLSYTAMGYFQYLFFYWIQYYFETIQKESSDVARWYTTMITLAMGLGMVSGGWLADSVPRRFSPRVRQALVPVLGMIGSGLVFELGLVAPTPQSTLAAFALAAALIGACEGGFWTTSVELGAPYGGTAAGLMNTGGNLGGTLSPTLTPVLGKLFAAHYGAEVGWRLSLAVAGCIVVAGAALWLGVDAPKTHEPAKEAFENALS
jgi:MFS family permease